MRKTIFILILTAVAIVWSLEAEAGAEKSILWSDLAVSESWGLKNIDAEKAWQASQKFNEKQKIIVAVIDTGIDSFHPDLKNSLWINDGEIGIDSNGKNKSINGIDDDKNGFIDDVNGWNFVEDNNDLTDRHGHGTHISGIIAAEAGNGIGTQGVSPNAKLMTLKYYDPKFSPANNLENIVQAIRYATKMGAHIINYSGGGAGKNLAEEEAIQIALQKNILFVAAAGNEGVDSSIEKYYPANYELENIISVASIDIQKRILASSNFGAKTVDIAAPGKDIYSTLPGGLYGKKTGTSQATAFVTGVAALLMENNKNIKNPRELIQYIVQTGDRVECLEGKTKYKVKLNSYRTLVMQKEGAGAFGNIAQNTINLDPRVFSSNAKEIFNQAFKTPPSDKISLPARP